VAGPRRSSFGCAELKEFLGWYATHMAANELSHSVAQTFCLPYRRLAACKVREGTVR